MNFIYLQLLNKQYGAGVCLYGVKLHVLLGKTDKTTKRVGECMVSSLNYSDLISCDLC